MVRYIAKRFGYILLTFWVIVTLTFVMMHAIPGDPFLSEKKVSEAVRANMLAKYGLDKPLHQQYIIFWKNLLQGELGYSLKSLTRTVNEMIRDGFPHSAKLGLWALAYAVPGGILLGIVSALHRNKWPDYVAGILAVIGVSIPAFIMGTLFQLLFGVKLGWFKVAGWGEAKFVIMPAAVLGLGVLAVCARMMRSSMLDVLGQDYIKTAKAKGLSGTEIVWRHALRNALLPIVTIMGPIVAAITTGSFIIESMFAVPGLGRYFVVSILNSDYTLIMGTTIFYAMILLLCLFLTDVAYGFVDPRIRLVSTKD